MKFSNHLAGLAVILSMGAAGPSFAQSVFDQVDAVNAVDRWYGAHGPDAGLEAASAVVGEMLADDAGITIVDLDVTQTKAEYIDALQNWVDAIEGGKIAYKVVEASTAQVSTRVCYRFAENEMLAEEVFQFSGPVLQNLTTKTVAEDCNGF